MTTTAKAGNFSLTATFPSLLAVANMAYFRVATANELWDLEQKISWARCPNDTTWLPIPEPTKIQDPNLWMGVELSAWNSFFFRFLNVDVTFVYWARVTSLTSKAHTVNQYISCIDWYILKKKGTF